jgi:hypothetical protein
MTGLLRPRRVVHFISPLMTAAGGCEWRTIELYRELKQRCTATLWATEEPDPHLTRRDPIRRLVPHRGPVVCERRGGYCESIESGRNGFLFDDDREAFEILMRLKECPSLRRSVGTAARETVSALFSPQ